MPSNSVGVNLFAGKEPGGNFSSLHGVQLVSLKARCSFLYPSPVSGMGVAHRLQTGALRSPPSRLPDFHPLYNFPRQAPLNPFSNLLTI